ncbi:MAG: hypothetical protein HY040_29285 [Planctomycetes bacterium]|nr:hypothetical protein [Planctomycetota bacterium]
MATRSAKNWTRILAGAALVFLASAFFAPGKARADCGDYVTAGGKAPHRPGMPQTSSRPCRQCPQDSQDSQEPGRQPCRGPQCSGGEQPLPLPPTTAVERGQENWAHFCMVLLLPERNGRLFAGRFDTMLMQNQPLSIFHPPRS